MMLKGKSTLEIYSSATRESHYLSLKPPIPTSHGCGEKKVLFLGKDFGSHITQIAVTALSDGETVPGHSNPTMEEFFLVRKGQLRISVGNEVYTCVADDFVYVPAAVRHSIEALTSSEILTIGCAIGDTDKTSAQ